MRLPPALLAAALLAAPAAARADTGADRDGEVPEELTDPKTIDRVTGAMGALSRAMLKLPIGEIEAAIEGRQPTAAERRRTLGDVAGDDFGEELAVSGEAMNLASRALASAMPAIMRAAAAARDEIERALANLPRPDYPRR